MARRLRLVKRVVPEFVATIMIGNEELPDWRCPECASGIAEEYTCCPYCGAELNWEKGYERYYGKSRQVNNM